MRKLPIVALSAAVALLAVAASLAMTPAPVAVPVAAATPTPAAAPPAPPPPPQPPHQQRGAWLGVVVSSDDEQEGKGARIEDVEEDSPADAAGLRRGDRILEIDGKSVDDAYDVRHGIGRMNPGDSIRILIDRDGDEKTLTATLADRPGRRAPRAFMWHQGDEGDDEGNPPGDHPGHHAEFFSFGGSRTWLGVDVQPMSEELRSYFKAPRDMGVLVNKVMDGTPAERAGLKAGDVIIGVDGKDVSDQGDISRALSSRDAGDEVGLKIMRDGSERTLQVKLEERPEWKSRRGALVLPKDMIVNLDLEDLGDLEDLKELKGLEELKGLKGLVGLKDLKALKGLEVIHLDDDQKEAVRESVRSAIDEAHRAMEAAHEEMERAMELRHDEIQKRMDYHRDRRERLRIKEVISTSDSSYDI
jgi:membrane-associated protease RseP (regulator of RpoE activity)